MQAVGQCVFAEQSVGVEKEHIVALALAQRLVVGASEAHVAMIVDEREACVRMLAAHIVAEHAAQIVHRPIIRMIVDHKHLYVNLTFLCRAPNAVEALTKIVPDVVRYNNNRKQHAFK